MFQPVMGRLTGRVEGVSHVADSRNHLLVLGTQLRPQSTHVHINRAGAAVVGIVAPDLREQLRARKDEARVHSHEFEELKLLESQVERGARKVRRVGLRVNH